MEFLVADAERLFAEGGKVKNLSFWGYKLMVRATLPVYQAPPIFPRIVQGAPTNIITGEGYVDYCTWHRYSDFEWFVEQLEREFPGVIFPPIPDKENVDGTKDKFADLFSSNESENSKENVFVRRRIRHFQLFFDYFGKMKELHEATVVKAFVTMEEPEWLMFKEQQNARTKPSGWNLVKEKGFSLFAKIASVGDKKVVAFPEGSPVAQVRTAQTQLGDCLRACLGHMTYLVKYGHYDPSIQVEESDKGHAATGGPQSIPPTLIYNGHFVSDAANPSVTGVVRHVEGLSAWVDFGGQGSNGPLTRVPLDRLVYPSSGTTDNTIFAAQELTSQIDSFCVYLSFRPEARKLEKLMDLLWFWARISHRVVRVIEQLQLVMEDLTLYEKELTKAKAAEKATLEQKVQGLRTRFQQGCDTLQSQYLSHFRPQQKAALGEIAFSFGTLSVNFLGDDDWMQRLQRADTALPLLFEAPPEVADVLAQEAKAHMEAYQSEQRALQQVAPQQQPAAVVAPAVVYYHTPQQGPQSATAPTEEWPPTPNATPVGGPAPTPTWTQPISTAPVDDDLPPPLPASAAHSNNNGPASTQPHEDANEKRSSGLNENWQTSTRFTDEDPQTATSDVPPPLP